VDNWEVLLFPSLASLFSWMHFGEIFVLAFLLCLFLLFISFAFSLLSVISTFFSIFYIPLPLQNICIFTEFGCSFAALSYVGITLVSLLEGFGHMRKWEGGGVSEYGRIGNLDMLGRYKGNSCYIF